jgi:putative transposase
MRQPYPTDFTDAEWEIIRPYVPEPVHAPNLMTPKYARRDVIDGIQYRERTGCQWRSLPHDFPPWKQVFEYFRKWRNDGTIERMHDALRAKVREQTPRADGTIRSDDPTICILDSQSAKTSEEANPETRGYDAGKKVKGRKRHLVVDAIGLLLVGWVTTASVQDRDAAVSILQEAKREYSSLQKVFLDGGYRGEVKLEIEQRVKLEVEITLRSDLAPQKGFKPLPVRWKVERTFGWLNRYRLLSKEFERTIASSQADIQLCMSRMMVRRLAAG